MIEPYGSPTTYPSKYLQGLLQDEVVIEEKIDGSQFSFRKNEDGTLSFKSRNNDLGTDPLQGGAYFSKTMAHLLERKEAIPAGVNFRGEVVATNRHNKLTYAHTPNGWLVLFGAEELSTGKPWSKSSLGQIASVLDVEVTQTFYHGTVNPEKLEGMLQEYEKQGSMLGGPLEGFVIKNHYKTNHKTGLSPMSAKVVTDSFKERMGKPAIDSKKSYAVPQSILDVLPTRSLWDKAIQHLQEAGSLTDSMKDIGPLMKEIAKDFEEENEDAVKQALWEVYRKQLIKQVGGGFPEYYRLRLEELEGTKDDEIQ